MTRLLAAFLACGLAAMAQEAPAISVMDVVAVDPAGNPVTGLTHADFEILAAGKTVQPVRFSAFDAAAHSAKTSTALPALELTPDQIHRTTVLVVDDLCLPVAELRAAKEQMRNFVAHLLAPGDQASILRTSGGSTRHRPFTSDARALAALIDTTEPLAAGLPPQTCASAAWSAVAYAVGGLERIPGRKTIVLLSGNVQPPAGNSAAELERVAASSMTAIYLASPSAPVFAATVGGASGTDVDRVIAETRTFYVLAIPTTPGTVEIKCRRPGVSLRSRKRTSVPPLPPEFAAAPDELSLIADALNSPFDGAAIGVAATALYTNSAAQGAVIEVLCHIDARDLSYLRDEQGRYHIALEAGVQSVVEAGRATRPVTGTRELVLSAEEYRRAAEDGLVVNLQLSWGAGPRDVRVIVADHRSGRIGTANVFTPSNTIESGNFFLSGIGLLGDNSVKQGPAVRVFRPGTSIAYVYNIFNPATDADGRSRVEVQTRLFAGGRESFAGKASSITFEPATDTKRRQVNGHIQLDPSMAPGRYIFHVTVAEVNSQQPRIAAQFIDFTVEP
jgi:VWFA-related protein